MLKGVLPEKHFECFGVMNFFLGFLFRLLHHSRHWYYHYYYYGKHFYDYLFKIKFFKCFSFVLATIHSLISLWTVPWITTNILAIQLLHRPFQDCHLWLQELSGSFLFPSSYALIHKVSNLFSIFPCSMWDTF